jgi:flavin-dependent thymidylate synthase
MKVTLVSWTQQPEKVVALGVLNMRGDMRHSVDDVGASEATEIVGEVFKTALNGVFEWVQLVFQIEGVSRAFTHQLVRHRTCSFSQESMRFTKVENMKVLRGPSITTTEQLVAWDGCLEAIEGAYQQLIDAGVDIQDARGLLPTNVLTRIGVRMDYRTLLKVAGDRLCLQAQDEWRVVMRAIKHEVDAKLGPLWAGELVPVCLHTGKCEFESIYDRDCPMKERLK